MHADCSTHTSLHTHGDSDPSSNTAPQTIREEGAEEMRAGGGSNLASVGGRPGAGGRSGEGQGGILGGRHGGGGYPESLHAVTLRPIPLYDELPKVQEENIPTVETLPGHLHLGSHGAGTDPTQTLSIIHQSLPHRLPAPHPSSASALQPRQGSGWEERRPCALSPGWCPPLLPPHSSCP